MKLPQLVMMLRRDFPYEVGWSELIRMPATETEWRKGEHFSTVMAVYGPQKIKTYGEYRSALERIVPDRLMCYGLWQIKGESTDTAYIQSRQFGLNIEAGLLPRPSLLFRETIERAEKCSGQLPGDFGSLRPRSLFGEEVVADLCLVHDLATGEVYIAEWALGYHLVASQKGGNVEETLDLMKNPGNSEA